jgi:hypothetical protein
MVAWIAGNLRVSDWSLLDSAWIAVPCVPQDPRALDS